MDAADLRVGDLIRTLDGSYEVTSMRIVEREQPMYNLTVDEAHTFFVGDGQWLVHNECRFQALGGFTEDVIGKGFHIDYYAGNRRRGEILLRPQRTTDGIQIVAIPWKSNTVPMTNRTRREIQEFIEENTSGMLKRAELMLQRAAERNNATRIEEANMFIELFSGPDPEFTVDLIPRE